MNNSQPVLLPDFSDLHVLVIGDVMLDRYISGHIRRISPEAPVPVVELQSTENRLGGAANVALNLTSLGAKVTLISIIGEDDDGILLDEKLKEIPEITSTNVMVSGRTTSVKTRVMAGNQHILRLDKEDVNDISPDTESVVYQYILKLVTTYRVDGVIIQDYNKGLLTSSLIQKLLTLISERNIPSFVDPKEKNFFAYTGCTVFKPNKKEAFNAIQNQTTDYDDIDRLLREKLEHTMTIITKGSEGMYINDGKSGGHYPTVPRNIADVCGAGDSVIAVVALCYIKKMSLDKIALIANIAGGQVCQKPGVATVDRTELTTELEKHN